MKNIICKIILTFVLIILFPIIAKTNEFTFANGEEGVTFEIVIDDKQFVIDEKTLLHQAGTDKNTENQGKFTGYKQGVEIAKKTKKMGFDSNIIMNYLFVNFEREINKIIDEVNSEPQDAKIEFYNNKPSIKKEEEGRILNKYKLYNEILQAFIDSKNVSVKINTQKINPKVIYSDLEKYTAKRGAFSTNITGNNQEGRKHNIANALSKFEGKRVEAGERVSFNMVIGDTLPENGYALAKIIINGKFVDGYGGGVCQASTTLYNALLLAGVDIIEVNPHSLRVGYVAPSFDSMVSYGLSDLVFENNTGSPIYISTYSNENQCGVYIYGEEKNYVIKKRTEILDKDDTTPPNVNIQSRGILEYYQEGDLIKTKPIRRDTYYFPKTE